MTANILAKPVHQLIMQQKNTFYLFSVHPASYMANGTSLNFVLLKRNNYEFEA